MYKIANIFAATVAVALFAVLVTLFGLAMTDMTSGDPSRAGALGTWDTGAAAGLEARADTETTVSALR
ncbi:MAG: hypothetical protein AAGA69_08165 [Pseudomonadota bacterium]